jgi:hypothetical protein
MGLYQVKKLLSIKRNNYQNEEIVYRMGKKSLLAIHWQKVNTRIYMELQKLNTKRTIHLTNGEMN